MSNTTCSTLQIFFMSWLTSLGLPESYIRLFPINFATVLQISPSADIKYTHLLIPWTPLDCAIRYDRMVLSPGVCHRFGLRWYSPDGAADAFPFPLSRIMSTPSGSEEKGKSKRPKSKYLTCGQLAHMDTSARFHNSPISSYSWRFNCRFRRIFLFVYILHESFIIEARAVTVMTVIAVTRPFILSTPPPPPREKKKKKTDPTIWLVISKVDCI